MRAQRRGEIDLHHWQGPEAEELAALWAVVLLATPGLVLLLPSALNLCVATRLHVAMPIELRLSHVATAPLHVPVVQELPLKRTQQGGARLEIRVTIGDTCERRRASRPESGIKVDHLGGRLGRHDGGFFAWGVVLEPPGRTFEVEHLTVMHQPVDDGGRETDVLGDGRPIAQALV